MLLKPLSARQSSNYHFEVLSGAMKAKVLFLHHNFPAQFRFVH